MLIYALYVLYILNLVKFNQLNNLASIVFTLSVLTGRGEVWFGEKLE